ncbi:GbsR/MarR family transcriptional regulator [Microbacterium sp. Marseille-Q6965]|uniref:GbsR/MarR family transcriptional regulator n=1 Tax=Microbacterium sp. Marseille-Q6965 TaxID=2965072 RepID=UPI0021B73A29|nr:MarR family transcriptional regulator [Microbacterium sp. Marseille-Q6965]
MSNDAGRQAPELDPDAREWVESFATVWEQTAASRVEGRVLGLLLICDAPYLSAADIARLLNASSGAVSTATRSLTGAGFLQKHTVTGDRRHYFRADDDVWGSFLAGERSYLHRTMQILRDGLALDAGRRPGPRTRLRNADRYMRWLEKYHRKMLDDWRAYRDTVDDEEDT